jgi:hypothetical protein
MFSLIRRISYGVIPRPDRPWEDDPTSNAPQRRRKRRLSSTERDVEADEDQANKKKARGESASPSVADAEGTFLTPAPQVDTQEVKEVTQGVQEVDLDGKDVFEGTPAEEAAPESIPLPDENSGELDEPTSDDTPPADVPSSPSVASPGKATEEEEEKEKSSISPADEAPDVASPSEQEGALSENGHVKEAPAIEKAGETANSSGEELSPAGTTED